ncbi:MAG: CvpA family protein [Chlorobi bacterium]|nr:CvpA family protein [Chlorobiota bacterium]
MTINLIDLIFLVPIMFFAYSGYKKGLIIEAATLGALILGLYFAIYFSDIAGGFLNKTFNIEQKYMGALSFVLTFIVVVFGVIAVGKALEKIVDILFLGFLNKMAGAVFGIIKGALFISVLIFAFSYFRLEDSVFSTDARKKSLFYDTVKSIAPALASWLKLEKLDIKIPDKEEMIDNVI